MTEIAPYLHIFIKIYVDINRDIRIHIDTFSKLAANYHIRQSLPYKIVQNIQI
jgi:hypothetical protein